jgi:hypothetical protein
MATAALPTAFGRFQLFDKLDHLTDEELRDSIVALGVVYPVVKDQHGNTLDGH